jgi:hypothetical protein
MQAAVGTGSHIVVAYESRTSVMTVRASPAWGPWAVAATDVEEPMVLAE